MAVRHLIFILSCTNYDILNLSNRDLCMNGLDGTIPTEFGNLAQLEYL